MAHFPTNLKDFVEMIYGSACYEKFKPDQEFVTLPGIYRKFKTMKKIPITENTPNVILDERTFVYAPVDSFFSILLKNIVVDPFKHLELTNPIMVAPHAKHFGSHWKFGKKQYRFIAAAGILGYAFLDVDTNKIVYSNTNWNILKVRIRGRNNPLI